MDCSMPGLPVHHQLLEFAQTHVHRVGDAIQPSHPLLSPSPPAFNLSQHQVLFQGVSSLHQVAKVLEFQYFQFNWKYPIQYFHSVLPVNIQGWSPLGWTGWISLQSKGLSRVFSNTVQNHQFFVTQLSLQSNSHIHTWPLEKTIGLTRWTFVGKVISLLFNILSRLVIIFLPRSKWISYRYTCISSLLNLLPISLPIPPL